MHFPVMRAEVLEYLAPQADGVYLDATAGLFGHTAAIAEKLSTGMVIASDRDAESLEIGRGNAAQWAERIRCQHAKFSELRAALDSLGIGKVDGLLGDLAASRHQLTQADRGFSFMADGPLDMRMDRTQSLTASEIVNAFTEKALADLLFNLGQERRARKIAKAIVRARRITSTLHLARVVERAVPRTGRIHPATQTFMALRIAVNGELEELDSLLELLPQLVASGGRIVIITFMSLEDRKVKQGFQRLAKEGWARILTKHVVRPTGEEVRLNAASRSAKLRAIEVL
jgi:16S rRNA (cytosine1402-N4)-methyltransferase